MTILVLLLALLPLVVTLANAAALKTPPRPRDEPSISILIPARDEEDAIGACVAAALASRGVDLEVLVLDDGSRDGTVAIVEAVAARDPRLRLLSAPPLPTGWNGKQHACAVLAEAASRPNLLFVDADVRLEPDAAARLVPPPGVDLVSGVPRQIMGTMAERLAVPMINSLLLGYLPIRIARSRNDPSLAAGCGQMMMVRASAYAASGGHSAIRASLHDGLKLPRLLRAHGYRTDLVRGSALAHCRMYDGFTAVWNGFLKNATEGMARPAALPVWTILLLGGHVAPWPILVFGTTGQRGFAAVAGLSSLTARAIQAHIGREPAATIALHPFGVVMALAIQWTALIRQGLGMRTRWRGRSYLAER